MDAIIFDMDGILIDSEPYWREAEIEIFQTVGIELDEADCVETQGIRIQEIAEFRFSQKPWKDRTPAQVADAIVDKVITLVQERGEPKEGALEAVSLCRKLSARLAVCSSSPHRLIAATLGKLGLERSFSLTHSAEDERYGKPHPAVYLTTAHRLGVDPVGCVAIEDSLSGVLAAKAARMACVAVPDPVIPHQEKFAIADAVIPSLLGLTESILRPLGERGRR